MMPRALSERPRMRSLAEIMKLGMKQPDRGRSLELCLLETGE